MNRLTDSADLIAKSRTGDLDFKDFIHEFLKAGVRAMGRPFHIGNQALKTEAKNLSFFNAFGPRGVKLFTALGANISEAAVFGNMNQLFRKFRSLLNPGFGFIFAGKELYNQDIRRGDIL